MGFYGNTLSEAPQSFRNILITNYSSGTSSYITAHKLEDQLTLRGSSSIKLEPTPSSNSIQFKLQVLDDYGNVVTPNRTQYLTTAGGSYIIQKDVIKLTGDGLVSQLSDIYIPLATETAHGLMSASDKANLKTLLTVVEGTMYEVVFFNTITEETAVLSIKENTTIDIGSVPPLPENTDTITVIGWKNNSTGQVYNSPDTLVNSVGAVNSNLFFTLSTTVIGDDSDPAEAQIYFINTDGTLTIKTGVVGDRMSTIDIPEIIDNDKYNIYGWTMDGKLAIRDDEWANIVITKVMSFNILKQEKESATLITKIRLGQSQYAVVESATAFLQGATIDKFGVVKAAEEITDPDDLGEEESLFPEDTEGPIVPTVELATRLASSSQSGWLSKKDKAMLDKISYSSGTSILNFCSYLGSRMQGFDENMEPNMKWVKISNVVFCSGNLTVRKSTDSTNSAYYGHECGLVGFPFKFANKGIINIYIQAFNSTAYTTTKVSKITQLVGQNTPDGSFSYFALFKMVVNDIGQYVIFDNESADSYENRIPATDLDIEFFASYITG